MMSIQSRRELLAAVRPRYFAANRTSKKRILDEFVASTGYHRKYAIYLFHHPPRPRRLQTRRRARRYHPEVREALFMVWQAANRICSKRLVPCLREFVEVLEHHGEVHLDPQTRSLLLGISPATADRLLSFYRQCPKRRGLGTTKPGSLLKKAIPVRTFAEWDDARPGFVEVDLVAHCGDSTRGEYLHSLVLTDISTAWTECLALVNRGQQTVSDAIARAQELFPFPLRGLDSDNGSEFINANSLRYCQQHQITFTRCRPYIKNDQAHVEQKNWSIVRPLVGYDRYEGVEACHILDALYQVVRLYVNSFQPVMKLISKERVGNKVKKRYDRARTPYQRVLESDEVSEEIKQRLRDQYVRLNPVTLLRQIESLQEALWRRMKVRFTNEATIPSG